MRNHSSERLTRARWRSTTRRSTSSLIDGLRRGRLPSVVGRFVQRDRLTSDAERLIDDADRLLAALSRSITQEANAVRGALEDGGIPAEVVPVPRRVQHATATIDVTGEAEVANQIMASLGYHPVDSEQRRTKPRDGTDYIKRAATTSRVRLRWSDGSTSGASALSRLTDRIAQVDPPDRLESLVRSTRQVLPASLTGPEKDLTPPSVDLGIYLGTPPGLIEPLLRFAGVGADDLVIDIGCGDGRVLIGAAQIFGCRARGYETDADLVAQATQAVADAGLSDRIEIIHADATTARLSDADAVFAFLPPEAVASILVPTLEQLPPTSVFLSHEQLAAELDEAPDRSQLVIGLPDDRPETGGITVANLWFGRRS